MDSTPYIPEENQSDPVEQTTEVKDSSNEQSTVTSTEVLKKKPVTLINSKLFEIQVDTTLEEKVSPLKDQTDLSKDEKTDVVDSQTPIKDRNEAVEVTDGRIEHFLH